MLGRPLNHAKPVMTKAAAPGARGEEGTVLPIHGSGVLRQAPLTVVVVQLPPPAEVELTQIVQATGCSFLRDKLPDLQRRCLQLAQVIQVLG